MKARIYSSLAALAMAALVACQGTSTDTDNTDSTGAINAAPDSAMGMGDQQSADQPTGGASTLDEKTSTFMNKAADAGMHEVEAGQLAQQKASNPRVKAFGQMMVNDHSKANDELKSIAAQKNFQLPNSTSPKHQDHKNDLTNKSGADFDKAYMKMMVDGHKDVIDQFEKASKDATDPDVKNFAAQKLPTLKMHLDSAQAIQKALK
jgi:Predicted outer membrane protein